MQDYMPVSWTRDMFPIDHKYFTFLKKVFRHEFRKNWFRRISTPILERWDISEKIFWDKKDNFLCSWSELWHLRPNAHIWIMRAFLNTDHENEIMPQYYYYMDRYFSSYKWNFKEFYQIGGEIIWEWDPILDAILIYINYIVLQKIGLWECCEIVINSMWVEKERVKYKEELVSFYDNKKHLLSEEGLELLEKNPIELLSLKSEDEEVLAKSAPSIIKFLKKDSKAHHEKFKEYLDLLGIPYVEDHTLVSRYDYATNSIWEFRVKESSEVLWTWFRYNKLSKIIWEPKEVPAVWFYVNIDMLIDILKKEKIKIKNKDKIDLYFVQLWDEAKKVVLPLSLAAREAWINTTVSLWTPSMKEQMLKSQRSWAKFVVMVWVMEARNGIFQVRDMTSWTQEEVKKEELIDYIISKIGNESLDFYCPAKDLVK